MLKRVLSVLFVAALLITVFAGCNPGTASEASPAEPASTEEAAPAEDAAPEEGATEDSEAPADAAATGEKYKVGITIQSLANSYWAGVFGEVENLLKEKGWDYTIVDCKDNSAEQISQLENFISAGCDMIMVHPSDPAAIEDVCAQAREAGIKVMCWDDKMTNTDINWVLENTALGYEIGGAAADFINEHYSADNKAEVAVMNYPQTPILLEREQGILKALEEKAADKYTIVAQQPAIEAGVAQSHMETILQASPNCKIVCSIGAGGDVGANEAFMAATGGTIPADMGIFSADATEQQMKAILAGQASRVSVGFEGSNKRTAEAVVDLYEKLLTGETFEEQNIVRPLLRIGIDNVETYLADYQ